MNPVQRKKDGLGYFNLLRGLGLLFIILGHSIAPFLTVQIPDTSGTLFQGAGRIFGSSVLALFFMISGLGFYRRSLKKCLFIQAKLLLKPYALTALSLIICKMVLAALKGNSVLNQFLSLFLTFLLGMNASQGGSLFGIHITTISILWFIVALFGSWVIYNFILHLPEQKMRYQCILGCMTLSWILSLISKVWPFTLPMVLMAVGYIAAGHEIRVRNLIHKQLSISTWCIVIFLSIICLMFGYVDMAACVWKLGPIDMIGTICIAFLMLRLYCRIMDLGIHGKVIAHLEHLGINSIRILCIHAFEHAIIPWRKLSLLFPNAPVLCTILCLLGKAALIWGLYYLTYHLPRKKRKTITIEP
ncbi:MAG: hypothetical protein IKJ99_05885 [Oscillospiraceae bacterium]|nr:hypothetical protein [Oscillospiraceae bacterium]